MKVSGVVVACILCYIENDTEALNHPWLPLTKPFRARTHSNFELYANLEVVEYWRGKLTSNKVVDFTIRFFFNPCKNLCSKEKNPCKKQKSKQNQPSIRNINVVYCYSIKLGLIHKAHDVIFIYRCMKMPPLNQYSIIILAFPIYAHYHVLYLSLNTIYSLYSYIWDTFWWNNAG